MKLLYCIDCGDMVLLQREKRTCKCGKAWGHYTTRSDTVQSRNSLSIGIANPDFERAVATLSKSPVGLGPQLWIRAWMNPFGERDCKWADDDTDI